MHERLPKAKTGAMSSKYSLAGGNDGGNSMTTVYHMDRNELRSDKHRLMFKLVE